MSEITFDDYAYHAWTTAYYLDYEPGAQLAIISGGLHEEIGELLTDTKHPTDLTAKLWGLPVEATISSELDADKTSEVGDVLYFVAAIGAARGIQLRDIAYEAIERYTGSLPVSRDDPFKNFDMQLAGRMGEVVPSGYKPNYHTWKMWDFAPFEDGLHIILREPQYAKGSLRLISDGRYALERLCSTLGRFASPEVSTDEEFLAAAGLTLGGLSIVLQSRFNSNLMTSAVTNVKKRERRQKVGALKDGVDKERSRKLGQERNQPTYEEGVHNNLLNAPLPEK